MVQDQISMAICRRFRQTRKKAQLTQPDYAKALGTNLSYIKSVEVNRHVPNFKVIKRWKRKFNVTYEWIIDG
jgi:transcriptional regulator with XRE-family HTH domain